jgi:hypothetical protein
MALLESDEIAAESMRDTIEALEGELEEKLIACAHVVLNLESAAVAIEDAAAKQQARAARLKKRAESLRAYMLFHAQCVGMKPIEHTDFVLKLVNNTPSVIIDDAKQIPSEFMRTPEPEPPPVPVPDKPKIAAALKADIEVPGARLLRGQRIEISP